MTNIKLFTCLAEVDCRVIDDLNRELHLKDDKEERHWEEEIIKTLHVSIAQTKTKFNQEEQIASLAAYFMYPSTPHSM